MRKQLPYHGAQVWENRLSFRHATSFADRVRKRVRDSLQEIA